MFEFGIGLFNGQGKNFEHFRKVVQNMCKKGCYCLDNGHVNKWAK